MVRLNCSSSGSGLVVMGNLVGREGCAARRRRPRNLGRAKWSHVRRGSRKLSTLALGAAAGAAQGRKRTDEVALDALKDVVPVLRARRCVAPEGDVRKAQRKGLDAAGELVAGLVGVDRRDDGARRRQSGEDPLEELELRAAGRAGGAQVPGGLAAVGVELMVAERVDGALGDDERSIVPTHDALPDRLGASGREAREADVLDFEAGDRARIIAVDEERVATRVVGPCAREA